jgi:hypothetical protein
MTFFRVGLTRLATSRHKSWENERRRRRRRRGGAGEAKHFQFNKVTRYYLAACTRASTRGYCARTGLGSVKPVRIVSAKRLESSGDVTDPRLRKFCRGTFLNKSGTTTYSSTQIACRRLSEPPLHIHRGARFFDLQQLSAFFFVGPRLCTSDGRSALHIALLI